LQLRQRAGKRALGFGGKLLLVPSDKNPSGHESQDNEEAQRNSDRRSEAGDLLAEQIGAEAIDRNPGDGSGHVRHHEARPRHSVGPGQDAGDAAQHRNEAGEEHDPAAVAQEQVLPDFDARLVEAQITAVAQQQPVSVSTPDPERDDIADDCASDTGANHRPDVELMRRRGIDRRRDEYCLPRHRNAHAFERDHSGDQPNAVSGDQRGDGVWPPNLRTLECGTSPG
jgi:hypothetical protein